MHLFKIYTTTMLHNATFQNITNLLPIKFNTTFRKYAAFSQYNGSLDPNYVKSINPFWLQFAPPTPQVHYTFGLIYLLLTIIGCAGNALVIFMFLRCKSLRTPANILVLNLAVSDFFMLCMGPIFVYNSIHLGPELGDLGCRIYGFIGGITGTVSITTLTAISIDRYHVIVYPLDPLRSTTKRRSRLMVAFVWLYSFIFAVIPAIDIGLSTYVPEGFLTACGFDYLSKEINARIFMLTYFLAAWCLPFIIISYCYFYILKVVISANKIQSSKEKNKTEIKLAAIVIAVIGLWFAAWTPYAIVTLLGITSNEEQLTPMGSMIPAIFCKIAACIDPYVYAVTHPRFRLEFGRIFFDKQNSFQRTSTIRSSIKCINKNSSRRHVIGDPTDVHAEIVNTANVKTALDKSSNTLHDQMSKSVCLGYSEDDVQPADEFELKENKFK